MLHRNRTRTKTDRQKERQREREEPRFAVRRPFFHATGPRCTPAHTLAGVHPDASPCCRRVLSCSPLSHMTVHHDAQSDDDSCGGGDNDDGFTLTGLSVTVPPSLSVFCCLMKLPLDANASNRDECSTTIRCSTIRPYHVDSIVHHVIREIMESNFVMEL